MDGEAGAYVRAYMYSIGIILTCRDGGNISQSYFNSPFPLRSALAANYYAEHK